MTLSDPNAPAYALATAAMLRNVPNTGQVLSGTYWNGLINAPNGLFVSEDFNLTFLGTYATMGGSNSTGFPYIMGMEDFAGHRSSWQTVYRLTAIPHCLAGGLVMLCWVPGPYFDSDSDGGLYGYNGWPIMGAGPNVGPNLGNWKQGLAATTMSFTIDATFIAGTGSIPASLDTSAPRFPPSGYLWVQTQNQYAIVSYTGWNAAGFTGCQCSVSGSNVPNQGSLVDYALMVPGTRQNTAMNTMLNDLNGLLVLLDGFGIAPLLRILPEPSSPNTPNFTFWYVGTPTSYYQAIWNYHFNYITGNALGIPIGGADGNYGGNYTYVAQPTVPNAPGSSPPTYPIHNAIWTYSQAGVVGGYGPTYRCPLPGYVDAVGLDHYGTDLATNAPQQAVWDSIRSLYTSNIILGLTEMGQRTIRGKDASTWESSWTQYGTPPNAYGPSFFCSWSNYMNGNNYIFNFANQTGAPAIWNSSRLKNLDPGAWSLSPGSGGMQIGWA